MKFVVRNNRSKLRLIPYIGNKSGFTHIFDQLIPDDFSNLRFYDVFGGGSAFTLYACERFGSKNVVYNDNNHVIVNLIKYVKKDPRGLINEYKKHRAKSSSDYYYEIRDKDITEGLTAAGRFLYLAKNAFSGKIRFNPHGKFNCPMRKNSKCPNIDDEQIFYISSLIQDLEIHNKTFEYFSDIKNSFFYLDPPYMNNPNGHYNALIGLNDFIGFVKTIEKTNKVMISEQNTPQTLSLSDNFVIHNIFLNRSLQYFTQEKTQEIIAVNYQINKSHLEKFKQTNKTVIA